jgi:anaerobic nitric oxide reductase flavorubredoxin
MIAPSHGVIWRDNPMQIVELYTQWCDQYQEHQATIIYDTMREGTRMLADAIADGMRFADPSLIVKKPSILQKLIKMML